MFRIFLHFLSGTKYRDFLFASLDNVARQKWAALKDKHLLFTLKVLYNLQLFSMLSENI